MSSRRAYAFPQHIHTTRTQSKRITAKIRTSKLPKIGANTKNPELFLNFKKPFFALNNLLPLTVFFFRPAGFSTTC